jgi:hypothetical protein
MRGMQTLACEPAAVVAGSHEVSLEHSLPFGHAVAQYVALPSSAQTPPLQSESVEHAVHDATAPPSSPGVPPSSPAAFDECVLPHPSAYPEALAANAQRKTRAVLRMVFDYVA